MEISMLITMVLSILLIVGVIYSIFKMFENSKPTTESIVLLAILIATASIGRLILISIPSVNLQSFIVIMVGIVFGKKEGFIVGSLSALVTAMILGIGPWVVFQMIGWGLMGLTAGLIAEKLDNIVFRVAFGLAWGLLYGWIADLSGIFYLGSINLGSVLGLFISSFPFDMLHGVSNAVLLAVFYNWFKKIFLRSKTKYLPQ
ncbi:MULTISPECIES: ECF transporter S component [Methanobrevibacter]|uniref:ECF transporter S component n=2 Tax=Methanobacteriaceae TaxID=2159 RepID=UPI0025E7FD7E|nr:MULTISPECIES: ECF transporter S component [Methanobrevibacter]MBS7258492.1 ECF transporter S component [Methanobrevibacter sp.]MCI7429061.1 ECF transporter S component [Methanobrevibacter sp.]